MSAQTIYMALIRAGLTPASACGLMGNMQCESALRANNAQDGMTRYSDAEYTAAVDDGSYDNFVRDAVGYGLIQWTYWTRKQALFDYARSLGVSIGNEEMQVNFCIQEIKQGYPALWKWLCSNNNVYDAASRICTEYERPAVNNISARAKAANEFFAQFGDTLQSNTGTPTIQTPPTTVVSGKIDTVKAVQAWLNENYSAGLRPDGFYGSLTKAAIVKALQKALGVAADGIYGPQTNAAVKVLHKGSKGAAVAVLQAFLVCLGYKMAYVDGDFGNGTEQALIACQKRFGLAADGMAGRETFKTLCG